MSIVSFKWFAMLRASCGFLVVMVALAALVLSGSAVAESAVCRDSAYLTWRPSDGEDHRLSIVDTESAELTDVAELPFRVNAVGYHAADDNMYGLARPDPARWERGSIPHLVAITPEGETEDLGALRGLDAPAPGLAGAYAGTVLDGALVVLTSFELVFIDLTDHRGHVIDRVELAESADTLNIGDFDTDGTALYGVDTKTGSIVIIDPDTGTVARTPITGLPNRSLAGATFLTPEGWLHAVLNGIDGEAVLFRMDPTATEPEAVEYGRLPAIGSADAAACRRTPAPEPPPSTSPTPTDPGQPSGSPTPSDPGRPSTSPTSPGPTSPGPPSTSPTPAAPDRPGTPSSPSGSSPSDSAPASPPQTASPSTGTTRSPADDHDQDAAAPPPVSPPAFPDPGLVAADTEDDTPRRRWIAAGVIILAMVGAAGAKASAKRSRR